MIVSCPQSWIWMITLTDQAWSYRGVVCVCEEILFEASDGRTAILVGYIRNGYFGYPKLNLKQDNHYNPLVKQAQIDN